MIDIVRTVDDLRNKTSLWRRQGKIISFVPTMGALHEGHISLVRYASKVSDKTVVSIFVNPTQFGENEDLSSYPRQEKQDIENLEREGVDIVFIPEVSEMYPEGFCTSIKISCLTECLCGKSREGHFEGVATVVAKLLLQVIPDIAVFGEKDFQQLQVIKRLVKDINIPVRIEGVPTKREKDNLAMSSRNLNLSEEHRKIAPEIYKELKKVSAEIREGKDIKQSCDNAIKRLCEAGFSSVDYFEAREENSLKLISACNSAEKARLFCAAKIGGVRLIDNIEIM